MGGWDGTKGVVKVVVDGPAGGEAGSDEPVEELCHQVKEPGRAAAAKGQRVLPVADAVVAEAQEVCIRLGRDNVAECILEVALPQQATWVEADEGQQGVKTLIANLDEAWVNAGIDGGEGVAVRPARVGEVVDCSKFSGARLGDDSNG